MTIFIIVMCNKGEIIAAWERLFGKLMQRDKLMNERVTFDSEMSYTNLFSV